MKLRKAIKKVFALGTGVTMLGATVLGAMAANLADYPTMFIKDGKFDGLMVVGAAASTEDVLGIVDIATSLQYSSKTETVVNTRSGGSSVTLTGDNTAISYGSDLLEIGERLGDVRETLTEYDLAALTGGTFKSDAGSTNYNQFLRFEFNQPNGALAQSGFVLYGEDEYDDIADYLYFKDGDYIFEYEIEFEEGVQSDVEDSSGNALTSGNGFLTDMEDEQINVLGQTYSIVKAEVTGIHSSGKMTLTLLGGDVIDTLKEQETKTYTIDGKDYEVTVLIISDQANSNTASVKFQVNGEVTNELKKDGDTDTLSDGTTIGIRDILANEGTEVAGDDLVEFYLGASKIVLSDSNYTDDTYDLAGVEIEEESIEDAAVKMKGSMGTSEFKVNSIRYVLKADAPRGNIYLKKGEGIRQFLDEPQGMIGTGWDVVYQGLEDNGFSVFEVDPSGDESYDIHFTNNEGIEYSFPYLDNSNDNSEGFKYGDDDNALWFRENGTNLMNQSAYNVKEDDYFIVNKDSSNEKAFTHVLTFDNIDTTNKILTFTDLATGQREVTYEEPAGGMPDLGIALPAAGNLTTGDLVVGGTTFKVWVAKAADDNYVLAVDFDGDGSVTNGEQADLVLDGGGIVNLGPGIANVNGTINRTGVNNGTLAALESCMPVSGSTSLCQLNLNLTTLSKDLDENPGNEVVHFNVQEASSNKVDLSVANVSVNGATWMDSSNNVSMFTFKTHKGTDKKSGMSQYGVYIEEIDDTSSTDADSLYIEYPYTQRGALVYVTSGATEATTTSAAGGVTTTMVNRIQVGKSVLDTTVSSVSKDNLIVVGGPCVNTVAATLMGNPDECTAGFEEGKAIIKLFENGNKVAMLVAGYSAADTRRASQVIANFEDYKDDLKGDEVVVSGTGLTVTDISAPEAVASEEAAPAEEATE